VDDNLTFLRLAASYLAHFSELNIVATADNGQDGFTKALSLHPQVILLDLVMPGLSGLQLIPRLRAAVSGVGIIVLTSHSPTSYKQAVLAAGADEFVRKADIDEQLLPAIRRVVEANQIHEIKGQIKGEDPPPDIVP
jgi:DNA-binding NarL/FixJ family response regulator